MAWTGSLRSRLLVSGLLTAVLVALASGFAWLGYRAINDAGQNSLRYTHQAMLMQMLIKDINQLITTEGAKAVRNRMLETVNTLDADLKLGRADGAFEPAELQQKRLARWEDLKGAVRSLASEEKISAENDVVLIKIVQMVARLDGIAEEVDALAEKARAEGERRADRTVATVGSLFLLIIVFAVLVFFYLYRSLLRTLGCEPAEAVTLAREIAAGRLNVQIAQRAGDAGSLIAEMARMRDRLAANLDSIRQAADENRRIRRALDHVSTGVVIADADRNIIYANRSAQDIVRSVEGELRQTSPALNADNLLGARLESLCGGSAAVAGHLAAPNGSRSEMLAIGERHLMVTANPVVSSDGTPLGSVSEWTDRTAEIMVEQEVAAIVSAAARGDLSKRVELVGKQGFFAGLASGLNVLLDNTEAALHATSQALERLSRGDLTETLQGDYAGIFSQLQTDSNTTFERLRDVAERIKQAVETIDNVSRDIAQGNHDLSARTEEQASTLNETAHSMETLSANVRKNAESASKANDLTWHANEIAARGGDMVERVVATMGDIRNASKRISEIVGVIDGIAFQTNILALNAAIEAARAGEHGRGFAVVATEVRSLSQRSAVAAREIKGLIDDSVSKVEAGASLVSDSGRTMAEVVGSVRQVAELMTDLAEANKDQSASIEQVTTAVHEMSRVTESNAALVEEAAASATTLEQQMRHLIEAVAMFKLCQPAAQPSREPAESRLGLARKLGGTPVSLPARVRTEDEWLEF